MSSLPSEATPWYHGPTLIEHLETVPLDVDADMAKPFRMPVQWVNRPNLDFRGFAGQIAQRHDGAGRRGAGAAVRAADADRAHRHRWTAISTRRSRASR